MSEHRKYKIGLIGHPISHSQSPAIFRRIFADRPDILSEYTYELIEEADFTKAYRRFINEYIAVNVTSPFKKQAFEVADICSAETRLCGAANLLVKENGLIKAYNTDCLAVRTILQENNFAAGDTAVIYGCSGAGQAAAVAACSLGMHIEIINRTQATADNFIKILDNPAERQGGRRIIIYTLPVAPEKAFCESGLKSFLDSIAHTPALEANYKSPHLEQLTDTYISGLRWLQLQALETYRILFKNR